MRPRDEYTALHDIAVGGVFGYRTGDNVTQDVVDRLGLVVGMDVKPANDTIIPRPAGNAKRPDWERYAIGQGLTSEEVAEMTVTQIRDRYPAPDEGDPVAAQATEQTNGTPNEAPPVPAGNATTDEWRAWVLATQDVDPAHVNTLGRDELRDTYGPKPE